MQIKLKLQLKLTVITSKLTEITIPLRARMQFKQSF